MSVRVESARESTYEAVAAVVSANNGMVLVVLGNFIDQLLYGCMPRRLLDLAGFPSVHVAGEETSLCPSPGCERRHLLPTHHTRVAMTVRRYI